MAITMNAVSSSGLGSAPTKKKFGSGGLLAVLLLLAAFLLLIAVIALPAILLHRNYDERLFRMNKEIESFDRANAQRASLLEKREQLRAQDSRKYYLKAATPALASAELQDAVKSIIEAAVGQGQVQNTQVAAPKDDGLVRNVSANFSIQTSTPNLRKIFYAIETAQPYLFIDNLTMRTTVGSNHKSSPGQEPFIQVQFDVAGVALVNAPLAANAAPSVTGAGSGATPASSNGNVAAGNIAKPPAALSSNSAAPSAAPTGKAAQPPPPPILPAKPLAGAKP